MAQMPHRHNAPETPPPYLAKEPTKHPTFFLRTKLLPPRLAPELLSRPRLTKRLLENLTHPVTLVTANAGSGKTTLVADFVRAHARRYVWYQLDHTDADPLVFLEYIVRGIKQAVPSFGDMVTSYLRQSADELAQQPERAVDVLLNEVLDEIDQQLILVLDDYHHLGADTAVHSVVDRLLAYLPDVMHIIIISRDVPPLALARLRSQASLAVIDRADLLFTDEETRELFRRVFDLEIRPEQLAEYRARTHGWITALQLVRQVAQRQASAHSSTSGSGDGDAPDLVEILRQSEHDIFDYFAEEVFADESEDVRQLLLRISLLDPVEAEPCSRLFPNAPVSAMLPALVRRNVFITAASDEGGEEFRLHPLFQDFLRRRLRSEIGPAGVAAEHARYAEFFLNRRQWKQAVYHLLAAEKFEQAATIVADEGAAWIAGGALASLASLADALPASVLEAHPRALAYRAEVARLRGEYTTAQPMFNRAAILLSEQGDNEGEAEALHSLATIARRRGDFATAFARLDRAIELTDERSAVRLKCGNTRGLCLVATGEWATAEHEFRVALQSAEKQNNERYIRLITHNLGLPALIRGDFSEALRWLRRMLQDEPRAAPMPQEATAHLNMARCYLYRGEMTDGEGHLNSALELCQVFNLTTLRCEIFEAYGNLYREQGDTGRAADFYERAARAYTEAGVDLARCELMEEQALLHLQTGDPAAARTLLDRLTLARTANEDERGVNTATLARGRVLLVLNEHEAARLDLERAHGYFRAHGLYYYEAQACALLAACALAAGEHNSMLQHLRRMLDLAARYDYEYWLRREVTHHPHLFAGTDAAELLPVELREQVAVPNGEMLYRLSDASPPASQVARPTIVSVETKPATDLTINMLGPVEVFRDRARPFAADAWTTKRARDILCFIAARRHRRASKDVITDTFWGEADFEVVEKNFHPTISHIRKALNSRQLLKQNFLLYRDGDYHLNPEFSYRIDTEEFDRLITEGDAARQRREVDRCSNLYEEAVKLYRGDFMESSYDEWVEEQRAHYRERYMQTLEILVEVAQEAQEWSRSLHLAQQILQHDSFREDVYCMIMRAYAALGNRMAVKEQYENLGRLLRKELGVEPAKETQKVYRELVG